MDRTKFNKENLIYWTKDPLRTIRGQFRFKDCEKAPGWTMIQMIVYTTVIYIFTIFIAGFIITSMAGTRSSLKFNGVTDIVVTIISVLFFGMMIYGIFAVITGNLIALGVNNVNKKGKFNFVKRTSISLCKFKNKTRNLIGNYYGKFYCSDFFILGYY